MGRVPRTMAPTGTRPEPADPPLATPTMAVGTPQEYALWVARLRKFLTNLGGSADNLEQVDARFNYRENRITLYLLSDPTNEWSVAETLSHEYLHSILFQMGEPYAARALDLVSKPVRGGERRGGI
jgi:hypothetical protein